MRDEFDPDVSLRDVRQLAVLYGVFFLGLLGAGWYFWTSGRQGVAVTIWLFGNGITATYGIVAVGWDALEYLEDRREAVPDAPDQGRDRELAPDYDFSQDFRIATRVVVALVVFLVVTSLLFDLL